MTNNTKFTESRTIILLPVVIAAILVIGFSAPVSAFRIGGYEVVVPVIAHNPGLHGTEWRTDLWIDNPYGDTSTVTLTFYPQSGGSVVEETSIEAYRGFFYSDIVMNTFGMDNAKGLLLVSAPGTSVEVRARIYNTGGDEGEFGQAMFGIPTVDLRRQSYVSGVSTLAGNRVSVGIANPTGNTFEVTLRVRDASDNTDLYWETIALAPHQLVQFSDVAARWGLIASPTITIQVNSGANESPIFAYASVVRNDTGDATFLFGTGPNT